MLYTVKEDLDLCIELKLTPAQLMFVKMLIPDLSLDESERRKRGYALSIKYQRELKGLKEEELSDLLARDIIIDFNDMGKCYYEYYEINPKYYTKFALKVYPMVTELYDLYPAVFINEVGKEFIARNCSDQEIAQDYLRAINKDPEEHKRVIEDLKWAKNNNAIALGLKKFVQTKYWLAIRELRKRKGNSKSSVDVTIV